MINKCGKNNGYCTQDGPHNCGRNCYTCKNYGIKSVDTKDNTVDSDSTVYCWEVQPCYGCSCHIPVK